MSMWRHGRRTFESQPHQSIHLHNQPPNPKTTNSGTVWRLLLGYLPANRDRREATLQRKRREYAEILPQYFNIPPEERTLQEQVCD